MKTGREIDPCRFLVFILNRRKWERPFEDDNRGDVDSGLRQNGWGTLDCRFSGNDTEGKWLDADCHRDGDD
jgi:hypothetical protein